MIKTQHITTQTLTTTYLTLWTGYLIFDYALFRFSADDVILGVFNGGEELITLNLASMKTDYKVDVNFLTDPVISMYSSSRWCLDLRKMGGLYPVGTQGIELKARAVTGTKTLNGAMLLLRGTV